MDNNPWDDIDLHDLQRAQANPARPLRPAQWWLANHAPTTLHEDILQFCTYLQPTTEEGHMRLDVFARFSRAVHGQFPTAHVEAFGSSTTGLSLPRRYI